jgi:predicted unusual protein kinase regulating ubiquinone biosynthesis (AarF/ABC1/UbiB family)
MKMAILGMLTKNDDAILRGLERMGFVAKGADRELLKQVGRDYLKTLGELSITSLQNLDKETLVKLSGYKEFRGKLRAVMKSVEYPEGYFYVERTLALLFGLVGQLAPKLGLVGVALPYASRVFSPSRQGPQTEGR